MLNNNPRSQHQLNSIDPETQSTIHSTWSLLFTTSCIPVGHNISALFMFQIQIQSSTYFLNIAFWLLKKTWNLYSSVLQKSCTFF